MQELLHLYKLIDQAIAANEGTIIVVWDGHGKMGVSKYTYTKAKEYLWRRANGKRILYKVKIRT